MHFFVKLVFAAPCNFFSTAAASHEAAAASLSHFFMKLFSAAPCSFLSVARAAQSGAKGEDVARCPLSSREYRLRQRWHELFLRFSALQRLETN
jgi:hypothetical protein